MIRTKNKVSLLVLFLLLAACDKKTEVVTPRNLERGDVCAVDGMILLDHAGPKAQIVWKDGKRSFFCEAREAFPNWLDPIRRKRISGFFVQDFSGQKWVAHKGNWIPAASAIFVIDSRKQGAMGVSYVSFSTQSAAQAFRRKNAGKIVRLSGITDKVFAASGKLQRQRMSKMRMDGHTMGGHKMQGMMKGMMKGMRHPTTASEGQGHDMPMGRAMQKHGSMTMPATGMGR